METELTEDKEKCEVTVKITLSKEELAQAFDKKYNKLSQTVKIDGFRKGKAPRQILESRYKTAVEKEVLENLITTTYSQGIKEKNIPVLTQPKIEEIEYGKDGGGLSFKAKVEVKPKIEISDYKGISLKKEIDIITDKNVEESLRRLQEKYAAVEVVEKPVGKNSIVIFDFESFKDGKPIPNGSHKDFFLEIGRKIFPAEFEHQLIGLKKGKQKEFKIKLPKDYSDPNMAGQKITFKVKINEIKERILPSLDDEFAKDIGDFNTIKELKEGLKKDLIAAAELKATQKLKDELMTILVSQHTFPIPKILIEREIDSMVINFVNNLQLYGLTLDDYLKEKKMEIDTWKEEFRPLAVERLKKFLILDAIAQQENIQIEDEEYETWVKTNFREQPSKIKEYLEDNHQKLQLKEELRMQKTLDFLVEVADIE